jgi:hypothetical protein
MFSYGKNGIFVVASQEIEDLSNGPRASLVLIDDTDSIANISCLLAPFSHFFHGSESKISVVGSFHKVVLGLPYGPTLILPGDTS